MGKYQIRSDHISRSVVSDSLQPHESLHARPSCPSPTPGVHSDSRSLSQWCYPAISSSVIPFSSCPQSLPASESFPMSHLSTWGGRSTGVSASKEIPGLISFRMDWLDLLAVQGTLKSLLQHHSSKASILRVSIGTQNSRGESQTWEERQGKKIAKYRESCWQNYSWLGFCSLWAPGPFVSFYLPWLLWQSRIKTFSWAVVSWTYLG